jgi:hypothetical protein
MFFIDNRGYKGFYYHYKIHREGKQGMDLFHPRENIQFNLSIHKTTYLKVQKKTQIQVI